MRGSAQAIIFDLFSTLISVSSAAGTPGRHTAEVLGVDKARWNRACFSEHHEICRPSRQLEIIRRLAHSIDPSIPLALIEQAANERQQRFDHALRQVEPDILETLRALRGAGIRLGLVSNASTDEVRAWPDSPLADQFDTVLFSCHCGLRKPQPAIYLESLRLLSVTPAQALFVGDGGSQEHLGARRTGIRSLQVTHFLRTTSADEIARLARGSSGQISHIRQLLEC